MAAPSARDLYPSSTKHQAPSSKHRRLTPLLLSVYCLVLSAGLGFAHTTHAAEIKIGYVNLAKVFDGYERTKSQDAALEKRGKTKEAELETRVNELKKMRQSLELLNDAARDTKNREVEEKSDELQRFRTNTARDLRRDRDQMAQEILKDIQKAIDDYAKANGFAVIFDQRGLFYAQPAYNVTDEVLKLLNSRFATPPVLAPAR